MAKFSIFKTPKNQRFEYRPRYWDPKKEKSQAFKDRINRIKGQDVEGTKARISSSLRSKYGGDPRLKSQLVKQSNIRIAGIIGILVLLSFFLIERYMVAFLDWIGN